mgnify:FL=1
MSSCSDEENYRYSSANLPVMSAPITAYDAPSSGIVPSEYPCWSHLRANILLGNRQVDRCASSPTMGSISEDVGGWCGMSRGNNMALCCKQLISSRLLTPPSPSLCKLNSLRPEGGRTPLSKLRLRSFRYGAGVDALRPAPRCASLGAPWLAIES